MVRIVIEKETELAREELKHRLENMISYIKTKWFSNQSISYKWSDTYREMSFSGKKFDGIIEIGNGYVKIVVNLSFMLWPFANEIDTTIENELEKALKG